jgi:hypothetical protein
LAQLTKEADAILADVILTRCIARGIPKDAKLVSRYHEMSSGHLRVRTFHNDQQIAEVNIPRSDWQERMMQ